MDTEYAFFVGGTKHGTWQRTWRGEKVKFPIFKKIDLSKIWNDDPPMIETFETERYERCRAQATRGYSGYADLLLPTFIACGIPPEKRQNWIQAALIQCAVNNKPREAV